MVLANPEFTRRLRQFALREDFQKLLRITEEQRLNQRGLEYAVRLVVHSYEDFPRGRDVQEFLDQAILKVMDEHDVDEVIERISWVIETLSRLFGENALIPPEYRVEGIAQRFSLRALEGIGVGLARNKPAILKLGEADQFITEKVAGFWQQPDVAEMSASGLRGSVRLQRTVSFGSQWFDPNA